MVTAMISSEDAQLGAMATFIKSSNMSVKLQNQDWAGFASVYNGPNYAQNGYDQKLSSNYAAYSAGNLPDLNVRAVQVYLTYKGYSVGTIDGIMGQNTIGAIESFQTSQGLPATGAVDITTLQALTA
jgi:peptidoglycan hydrolase-like protein with peptidoglycan-binding domain